MLVSVWSRADGPLPGKWTLFNGEAEALSAAEKRGHRFCVRVEGLPGCWYVGPLSIGGRELRRLEAVLQK